MKMRRKNKKTYFTTIPKHVGFFSKIIIVILVFGMIIGHLNLAVFAKLFEPVTNTIISDDVNRDFSKLKRIEEVKSLRTVDSKTYLKENGMYETEIYGEIVHYLKNGIYQEIDNTLKIDSNNKYYNVSNSYNITLPKFLSENNEVTFNYLNNEIKIYYDTPLQIEGQLSNIVDRTKINLSDEISYRLNNKETIQYILKQNSIKENVILNSYTENYEYSYYIDTLLRVERIGNELHFFDNQKQVFVMNEYVMYDADNNSSNDISFDVEVIDNDTYKITVVPSDTYLRNASYPVVIDPEIYLMDGGYTDGITSLYSIDKQADTVQFLTLGSFTLENRNNSITTDDKVAQLCVWISREYTSSVGDIITRNQLMYANITLTTVSTNATSDTKVNMKYGNNIIDTVCFHNSNVFNHKFNIMDAISDNITEFKTNDIEVSFELSVDGANNTEVEYSLGYDLGGNKPVITLGYLDDAGLADYYTYESLPLNDKSNVYIAHNSGNLTYIYNDYTDNNLLNLSHIYNANRKYNESIYGNGFNLSYNEELTIGYNTITLIEGNGRKVIFNSTNAQKTEYLATDGSGDTLLKLVNTSNAVTGYEVKTKDGGLKIYNSSGKLAKIYLNESDRVDGVWKSDAKYITITYNNNEIKKVEDSFGNYMLFTYLTIANDPSENQQGIAYLAYINIYKKDPTITTSSNQMVGVSYIEFEYMQGNLIAISEYKETTQGQFTYFEYNNENHISKIHKNGNGYTFTYDNKNRVTQAKVYSTRFTNGDFLDFVYNKNGKKTIISNGTGDSISYTFDAYYHTNSVENTSGYTTFYKYEDIYFDEQGNTIVNPNYNKNHKVVIQSNSFKNVINPIVNHGFEVVTQSNIYGWEKEVTNNSTASIVTDSYLYGSRVLELNKKSTSGVAKVYQDIDVVSGKEYIIEGYIKNTHNNGTGAYIDVVGINGTITPTSKSSKIKSSKDFCRYEYKFTSSFTGKVRIYLINDSLGRAYFDNIQVNTNYVDTRYNYLENSSFENSTITGWSGYNYITTTRNESEFNSNCGNKVLKLAINGYVNQTINAPGLKGDTFVFGGYCFYENYTGDVSVKLTFIKSNGTAVKEFTFSDCDINASYMMSKFEAPFDYTSVKIEIRNNSNSSYANVDNFALYKEGYGINLSYNDNGYLDQEYDETSDNSRTYDYDSDGNLIKVTVTSDASSNNSKSDVTDITYNDDVVSTITNKNITSSFETDNDGNITKATASTTDNTIEYYYGSTTYTADGLYPVTSKDVFGNITTTTYDYITGLVTKIIGSDGVSTEYTYDENGNLLTLINGLGTNKRTITYTYDTFGNLASITTNGLTYTFTYNNYGDLKEISVGGKTIVTNSYQNENCSTEVYTGKLNNTVYSYGTVYFEYDEESRVRSISYKSNNCETEKVLEYTYNDYGEVASYTDLKENVTYYYNYDYQNRLINVNASNGNNITYTYDSSSNLVSKTNLNGTNSYTYGDVSTTEEENEKLIGENISNKFNINYMYSNDSFAQLETIAYYISTTSINKNFTYETTTLDGTTYYTGRIKEFEYKNGNSQIMKYVYSYDKNNNITNILGYENGTLVYQEENNYDIFNQITTQYLLANGKEIGSEYFYDLRGNIISYYSQNINTGQMIYNYSFTYQTTGNKDELYKVESYTDNQTHFVEYSSTGQPSLYFGWSIGYDMRSISTLINDDYEIDYAYNANGIRISKSVTKNNSTTNTTYTLNGNNIIKEVRSGETNETLQYFYDSNDEIIGFIYNNTKYLYLKNIQKDIIGIVDSNNNVVVKYYYDAYGRIVNTIDTSGISLSTINPFRYRSYYQDDETGWYYLNSRYYNPIGCRFVTIDEIDYLGASGTTLSYNLFSYCENNPINMIDTDGCVAISQTASWLLPLLYSGISMLALAGKALIAKITAMILAIAPYLFWVVAAVAVVVLTYYTVQAVAKQKQKQKTIADADAKIKSIVTVNSKTRYWSATLGDGCVDIGTPLSKTEAVSYVRAGKSIFTVTSAEAYGIFLEAGGDPRNVIKEIDKDKENIPGYYWHYHINRQNKAHIWYLF